MKEIKLKKAADIMSSKGSWEREHDECYDTDEERSICSCGFIGFKRNQVIDCSLSLSLSSSSEIGEEDSEELFEINLKEPLPLDTIKEDCESTVFSLDIHNGKDVVYVAVGSDGDSSMEALSWALNHAVTPSATVCLVHVFPQVKLIPSPLGKIPRSHVNLEYVNMHLTQEKGKRKLFLQKFIDLCVDSKVKVEMMLLEGDNVAKAITDLVGNLNIRKLVIGITKSNLRKYGSRRQNAIAAKVLKNAQESCDIKIICEGREVIDQMIDCTSPRSIDDGSSRVSQEKDKSRGFVPLKHFMSSSLWLFRSITKIR
ncbi:U-box domain-containing protein 33 [Spatholobus suberectus]|nr:U-box domain-containing protein 33 [Spatholobus suberectus]